MGSNAERLSQARKLVGSDPMSRYLGLELVELDEARAVTKSRPTEAHLTAHLRREHLRHGGAAREVQNPAGGLDDVEDHRGEEPDHEEGGRQ